MVIAKGLIARGSAALFAASLSALVLGATANATTLSVAFNDPEFNKAFMARHPDIQVQVTPLPDLSQTERNAMYVTRALANELPDVLEVHYLNSETFIKDHLALDLTPFLQADKAFAQDDFFPPAWIPFEADGKKYGVPKLASAFTLLYNVDLINAAGLGAPPAGWNADAFRTYLKKLTKVDAGGKVTQWGGEDRLLNTGAMLQLFDAAYLNDDESRAAIDSPEAIEALGWWQQVVVQDRSVSPDDSGFGPGKAGFTLAQPGFSEFSDPSLVLDAAAPLLSPKGQAYAVIAGTGIMISASTKAPQAAWTYLSEYLSADHMKQIGVDARRSAVQARIQTWVNRWPGFNAANYLYAMAHAPYDAPRGPHWNDVRPLISQTLGKLWKAQIDPKSAVQQLATQINAALSK